MHQLSRLRRLLQLAQLLIGFFLISVPREAIARPPQQTVVTNHSDFALRDAIAQGGTITFSTSGTIFLTNAIEVSRDVVVDGGTNQIAMDGLSSYQMFRIAPGIKFEIRNLTIANGFTQGVLGAPGQGGAIFNEGTFAATQCVFSNNVAVGGDGNIFDHIPNGFGSGGALYSTGEVLLTNNLFLGNQAIGGQSTDEPILSVGGAAFGGAFYLKSGTGYITNSVFITNQTQAPRSSRFPGNMAAGGALYLESGNLTIGDCQFDGNLNTGAAGRGFGGPGFGGALYLGMGQVEIIRSQFQTNLAAGGFSYDENADVGIGGPGNGGAVYVDSSTVSIHETSFIGNIAQAGESNLGSVGKSNTPGSGSGGGIFNKNGTLAITNSTIAQNQAIAGAQPAPGPSPLGGDANGAGIYNAQGHLTISFSTIAQNTNSVVSSGTGGSLAGDGIYNLGQTIVDNSIIAYHNHENIQGTIIDGGHNISSDGSADFTSSLENTDPRLGPVANNGGPTLTMGLLDGSPAIDAASTNGATIDQRGNPRPFGAGFDIGAVEQAPSQNIVLQIEAVSTKVRISFIGRPNTSYELKASTDLGTWTNITFKTTDPVGKASFLADRTGDYTFYIVAESTTGSPQLLSKKVHARRGLLGPTLSRVAVRASKSD